MPEAARREGVDLGLRVASFLHPGHGRERYTPRTDDLYDLYDSLPLHDLDPSGQIDS